MKAKIIFNILSFTLLCVVSAFTQSNSQDYYPPQGEAGKCFAKCLIQEVEPEPKPIQVKSQTDPPQYMTHTNCGRGSKKGGFTEWREVICEIDVNKDFLSQLQAVLIEKGYATQFERPIITFDTQTKRSLVDYQKENGLPIGQLDLETLRQLGISI